MTEHVTIAEHFGGTLEQDDKQKSAKFVVLQLHQFQGQEPKMIQGPPTLYPPRVPRNPGEKNVFKGTMQVLHINSNPLYLLPKEIPPWAPPRADKTLRGSPVNSYPIIPLNGQRETKVRINGKPYQILLDAEAILSILNPTTIG